MKGKGNEFLIIQVRIVIAVVPGPLGTMYISPAILLSEDVNLWSLSACILERCTYHLPFCFRKELILIKFNCTMKSSGKAIMENEPKMKYILKTFDYLMLAIDTFIRVVITAAVVLQS